MAARRRTVVLALVAVAVSALALAAAPAGAHTQLRTAEPVPGSRIVTWPSQVRMEFRKPLRADRSASVSVKATDGRQLAVGAPQVSGSSVAQAVRAPTVAGPVVVSWSLVTTDGHRQEGGYDFLLARLPPASRSEPGGSDRWLWLAVLGGLGGCGLGLVAVLRRSTLLARR